MIEVLSKGGIVNNKSVISFIIKSSKHRWIKTHLIDKMSLKQTEIISLIWALQHIVPKKRRKAITIHIDSQYLFELLERDEQGEYKNDSSLDISTYLRLLFDQFDDVKFNIEPEGNDWEELQHVYAETGYDDIILDEKEHNERF